jgi:hypothetical protein
MTLSRHHVVYDCVVFAQALISPGGPSDECVNRKCDPHLPVIQIAVERAAC